MTGIHELLWNEVVCDPTAQPDDVYRLGEGDIVNREDATFTHGSIHWLVLQGPTDEAPLGMLFVRHGDDWVAARDFDDPAEGYAAYLYGESVLRQVDPLG